MLGLKRFRSTATALAAPSRENSLRFPGLSSLYLARNELVGCPPQGLLEIPANDFDYLNPSLCPSPRLIAEDRAALVAFYQAAGGAGWTLNYGWLSDAPVDQWHGVVTDNVGRVSGLILDDNGLSGAIPPELGRLSNLIALNLNANDLSGAIPPELGQLSNLESLWLSDNDLSGAIPSELGQLANLEWLGLGRNDLSGAIPRELGQLGNLQSLELAHNNLSGGIPPELGQLANLRKLWFVGNNLSGAVPPELGQIAGLNLLDLSYNNLSGGIPPEFDSFTIWTRSISTIML